jgi:soluble lytic murein transglycosylase
VALLFALGERELALQLAVTIARTETDESQVAALAAVVEATQDAKATLTIGKAAAQRGVELDEAAFPTFGIPGYQPLSNSADRSTVFAIARQESEFNPKSVSSAGAKGLMQLIASTAKQTAERAGVGFDENRLLNDAAFNAQIGAAHLGKLLADHGGSYILTFAAYNAGSRKVQDWIEAYGDPRKPGVDPVDWIERIPFTETRNYVQRVFENMQIYRTRFGMPIALLSNPPRLASGKGT